MTKPMMDLRALVEKSADADLLREMISLAAERLMEFGRPPKDPGDRWQQERGRRQARC